MVIPKLCLKQLLIGLLIICGIAGGSMLLRSMKGVDQKQKCFCDGAQIEPLYEIQFHMRSGEVIRFCSAACAMQCFDELRENIAKVLVTDEASARKIDANDAFFLESQVITVPHVKNDIHMFADENQAIVHRDIYSGVVVDNPFRLSLSWIERLIENRNIRIKIDRATGLPLVIRGTPFVVALGNFRKDDFEEEDAWNALSLIIPILQEFLDVGISDFKFASMELVGNSWYISFWQIHRDVIIYESSIGFSVDDAGEISSIGTLLQRKSGFLDLPSEPKFSLDEARDIAVAYITEMEPYEYEFVAYQLVVVPIKKNSEVLNYHLAYILNFFYPEDIRLTGSRAGWVCFVDAVTAETVKVEHLVAIASCCMPVKDES